MGSGSGRMKRTALDAEELQKAKQLLPKDKLFQTKPDTVFRTELPENGLNRSQIMTEIEDLAGTEHKWQDGSVSGGIYNGDPELTEICSEVSKIFTWSNPLHPDVFPGVPKLEAEIARMACDMFCGDPTESCGCVTSGGTESILLAVKAYRDWAYERGIKHPEIVCPVSAHAAFHKASHYFRVKLVLVRLDKKTWKVDMKEMKRAINKNTCLLVGSAPQFPHGIMDPIEEIATLGTKYGIPVHVDACLGGFLIAFMGDAGFPLSPFDFRLPGVTSISADTHKYGFAPKGTSCILYSSRKWRRYQYSLIPDWQGGAYCTHTMAGSRTGTVIAACWASMVKFGRDGYVNCTRKIVETQRYITSELRKIDHIYIFGEPEVSVVAVGSVDFDVLLLSSALHKAGWHLNSLQFPSAFHFCCTMLHTQAGVADRFISDVKTCVAGIMANQVSSKPTEEATAVYGMSQLVQNRSLVTELATAYLDSMYET